MLLPMCLEPSADAVCPAASLQASDSRPVGVWVMTMFDEADQFHHWNDVRKRHASMPVSGPFSCSDPAEVAKEYGEIRDAGIDYVLLDDTNTIGVDGGLVDKAVQAWFDYSDAQPKGQRLSLAIAAGGELNQHSDPVAWRRAVDTLYVRYAHRPSYLKAEGKPVLYWYIERDVDSNWADSRWTVRRTYHFFRTKDQFTFGGWGYGSDDSPRPDGLACASIQPGWDQSGPGFPRNGGDTYCNRWIRALQSHARSILLSDWNGWNEGTALSRSLRWLDHYGEPTPTWYIDLTRGYVQLFKGHPVEGFYYREDGQPDLYQFSSGRFVYQSEYPDSKPTIVAPKGQLPGFPPSGFQGSRSTWRRWGPDAADRCFIKGIAS